MKRALVTSSAASARWLVCTSAFALALGACGGAAPTAKSVTVVAPPATASSAPPPPPRADPHVTLTLAFEDRITWPSRGLAIDGGRLYVNVRGALQVFDRNGPVTSSSWPSSWHPGDPLVVVGDAAFDPIDFASHDRTVRQGCEGRAFSYDATRMSTNCTTASSDGVVYVYDTRSGAELGAYQEFQTAAPIRSGAITSSGNFIFWQSRAAGAFEEIKSHVAGPMMSSHSVMSRDETMVFTTVDRTWYTDDRSPARVLDPKNGRTLFTLGRDVDTAVFSPSSRLLAVHHSANWADLAHYRGGAPAFFTIHDRRGAELARVPGDDAVLAAFAPDDSAVAVELARGSVAVYSIGR